MKRLIMIIGLLVSSCGPDIDSMMCPPHEIIESRGIPERHLKVLECAGYKKYVISNTSAVFFVNEFPGEPKRVMWANYECNFMVIINSMMRGFSERGSVGLECWLMVNCAFYLINGDYTGSNIVGDLFQQKVVENNCLELI